MTKDELKARTKRFHVDIITVCQLLPKNVAGYELARQLIRSGGSVGANYRAACRAKSTADFVYKLEIVIEEADECMYWLEVISEADLLSLQLTQPMHREANELTSIFVAAVKTTKTKNIK